MAKNHDYVDVDTGKVLHFRTFEEQLAHELKIAKRQIAALLKENAMLRKQAGQPDIGPVWPKWIMKDTVEKTGDKEWPYSGMNQYYDEMLMHKSGRWERLARVIYQENFGDIPEGHDIRHLDGDKTNNDPENLVCLSREEFYREKYHE